MKAIFNKVLPKLYGFYFNLLSLFSQQQAAQQALRVFSIPRKGKITPLQQDFLRTAKHQLIGWDEGVYALYSWKGTGPTVLLLHGWESNAFRWKYLIEPLVKLDYNIIAIDAPAHGATDGVTFTAIKYASIIKQTIALYTPEIIVAHSVGALATMYQEHLTKHPFIKKFVFLGSPNKLEQIMRGYQQVVSFNERVYKALDRLLLNSFGMAINDFNAATFARALTSPTLLIHNPNDVVIPYPAMEEIASQIQQVTTYTAQTGGHSLYTPEVVDAVINFIEQR